MHSHNDYEQQRPFFAAYNLNFDSIEADLYLKDGKLYVAHNEKDISSDRTFDELYLFTLLNLIKENKGRPYNNGKPLQLLLDLKKDGREILKVLEKELLPQRKALKYVKIVISGDMPTPDEFKNYDVIFNFDGRKTLTYSEESYKRVAFVSASFSDFGKIWTGKEPLPNDTFQKLKAFIDETHRQNRGVRLWGTPSTPLSFETLKKLQVDFIGTDDLAALANFMAK